MASKKKYIAIGVLQYRSELDDAKTKARTYKPGDTINEDLDEAEIEKLVRKGAIKEAKQAQAEQAHRDEVAEAARLAEEAAAQAQSEIDAEAAAKAGDAAAGDTDATPTTKVSGNKQTGSTKPSNKR